MTTTDIQTIEVEARVIALAPVSDNRGALARYQQLQEFVKSVMVPGEDYGQIPGVSKPSLFKPGAEKLTEMYGLAPMLPDERRRQVEDWDKGFWHYEVVCSLVSRRTGEVVAEGIGSCNSMEDKYRSKEWFNGNGTPPDNQGWQSTRNGKAYRFTENPTRWNLPNTLLKMAKKRALVDAVLSVTRSSGLFTQDVEDLPNVQQSAPAQAPRQEVIPPRRPAKTASPPPMDESALGPPRTQLEEREVTQLLEGLERDYEDATDKADVKELHDGLPAFWDRLTGDEQADIKKWEKAAVERVKAAPAPDPEPEPVPA